MVTLPNAQSLGVASPRSQRGIVSFDGSAGAKGMISAGEQLQAVGAKASKIVDERQAEQDKFEAAQFMLSLKQAEAETQAYIANNPSDYENFDKISKENYAKKYETGIKSVSNKARVPMLQLAAKESFLQQETQVRTAIASSRNEHFMAYIIDQSEASKARIAANPASFDVELVLNEQLVKNSQMDVDDKARLIAQIRRDFTQAKYDAMNPLDAYNDAEAKLAAGSGLGAQNFNADTVKPYTAQRVAEIKSLVEKPSEYDALFTEMGQKYGVDPKELKLRAAVESGLNPTAQAKATPYGQSGGLMQLETKTAKSLGVTDRNDPRQSIEGAAKLLAQHQKVAGGDQTKVDKLYYAGSEKMMGPNTEQYAENLAAVRGGTGVSHREDTDVLQNVLKQNKAFLAVGVRDEMKTVSDAFDLNVMTPEPKLLALADKAKSIGMVEETKKIMQRIDTQKQVMDFVPKSNAAMATELSQLKATLSVDNPAGIREYQAKAAAYKNKQEKIAENPWTYYQSQGVVKPSTKDMLADPIGALAERKVEAQKIIELEGGTVRPPLMTDTEVAKLVDDYAAGKDIGETITQIGAATTPDEKRRIALQISKKDMSIAGAMAVDRPEDANIILQGAKQEGNVSKDKFREAAIAKLNGAFANGVDLESAITTLHNHYKQSATMAKDVNTEVTTDLLDKSIARVLGNLDDVSYGGTAHKVILPVGMSAWQFENKMRSFDEKTLAEIGGARDAGNVSIPANKLLQGNRMVSVGNGLYELINERTGAPILNNKNEHLVLDISKIPDAPEAMSPGKAFMAPELMPYGM